MNLSKKINSIELKVRELAFKLERLKRENSILKEENQELRKEIESLNGKPRPAGVRKASVRKHMLEKKGEEVDVPNDQLKEKIDQYIKEIDKCIKWLNNY